MPTIKSIIEDNTTRAGRIFDLCIQVLILFSILSFTLETMPSVSDEVKRTLHVLDIICLIVFSLEYILRIVVADKPIQYATSFFGIIDLMAIAPFYLALGLDLRAVRLFRVMKIFRTFKIARYSKAIERFGRAFKVAKEEIILFSIMTLILLYISSVGIYYFEHAVQPEKFASIVDSMWWSVATLTTVGYGDIYPITVGGKIFTFLVLMIGLGVVSVPAGLIASAFHHIRRDEKEEKEKMEIEKKNKLNVPDSVNQAANE
jgi:voltage-gated potassium channel